VYYPKKYTTWKKAAIDACPCGQLRLEDPLLVLIEHVLHRPKKPSNPYPAPDLDNFDKSAYDAVTSLNGYWQDDKQVVTGMSWKRYARTDEEPGTNIEFYKMNEKIL
jgi:Holliday junction resolvase RusA-like endonuclease